MWGALAKPRSHLDRRHARRPDVSHPAAPASIDGATKAAGTAVSPQPSAVNGPQLQWKLRLFHDPRGLDFPMRAASMRLATTTSVSPTSVRPQGSGLLQVRLTSVVTDHAAVVAA